MPEHIILIRFNGSYELAEGIRDEILGDFRNSTAEDHSVQLLTVHHEPRTVDTDVTEDR